MRRAALFVAVVALATGCHQFNDLRLEGDGGGFPPEDDGGLGEVDLAGGGQASDLECRSTALNRDAGYDAANAPVEAIGTETRLPLRGDAVAGNAQFPVSQVAFGDVTGDGIVDLVALGTRDFPVDNELTILPGALGPTRALFAPVQLIRQPSLATVFALGDVDGNPGDELVLATDGVFAKANEVSIARWNPATSQLEVFWSLPAPSRPRSLLIGDLDRDGASDLVVGFNNYDATTPGAQPDGTLRIYWGGGEIMGAVFTDITGIPPDPSHLVAADLDGDCLPELIVAHRSGPMGANFAIIDHDAPRVFLRAATPPAQTVPSDVIGMQRADLDRDGRDDLVVACYDADTGMRSLRALYAQPRGLGDRFDVRELADNQEGQPAIGDFNHDSHPDVLFTTTAGALRVSLGQADRRVKLRDLANLDPLPAGAPLVLENQPSGRVDIYYFDGASADVAFRLGQ